MSDQSDEESASANPNRDNIQRVDNNVDEETLRIMISTDNHLGYAERDPIRGNDSFAAFEEVLLLAQRHNCDMVLLAGDLFHDNKPSRRTLHKTLSILRRLTMGPNPVSFQIVSDQAQNFRSAVHSTVNYEDPYSSVDLPIFSIHGNHDDPTRDGGTEMLAALDLLAVSNLVNYFGRQDEVDKVQVSPVLIRKGMTKVALYGIGSMRDERLNRMWQGKKVRFAKPQETEQNTNDNSDDDDEEDDSQGWFNIFALHQNRDVGRGTKNCVHESMIPEWMDLVVWGHEHECLIHPSESAVGTFRITQPGSSVATSLTDGEAIRKHVGILDVRGSQFRLVPIPLRNVRSFAVGQLVLSEHHEQLDPEDPRIDDQMTKLLSTEVKKLIAQARKDSQDLKRDIEVATNATEHGGGQGEEEDEIERRLKFRINQPGQVLVRLKVEHSGFSTLHNQRFGSMFVKDVANPSDILLFHRRRTVQGSKSSKQTGKTALEQDLEGRPPVFPEDLDDVQIEDIVKDTLDNTDKKMMILEDSRLSMAVSDYISKETKACIGENVKKMLSSKQKKLVKRGQQTDGEEDDDDNTGNHENKVTTVNAIREMCQNESVNVNDDDLSMDDGDSENGEGNVEASTSRKRKIKKATTSTARVSSRYNDSEIEDMESQQSEPQKKRKKSTATVRRSAANATSKRNRAASNNTSIKTTRKRYVDDEIESSDDEIEEKKVKKAAPRRRVARATTLKKKRYTDDDDTGFMDNDDSDIEIVSTNRSSGRASKRGSTKRSRGAMRSYEENSDDDDWGTASSSVRESSSQRSRRR